MNIIDHLSVGVANIDRACKFYDGLLETLGVPRLAASDGFAAYGVGAVQFLIMRPENGEPYTPGNGVHICFVAPNKAAVDAFHAYAVAHDGEGVGKPGPRPGYPAPDVYTTFVRDPYGNKLEAIYNGFAPEVKKTEETKSWIQRFFS